MYLHRAIQLRYCQWRSVATQLCSWFVCAFRASSGWLLAFVLSLLLVMLLFLLFFITRRNESGYGTCNMSSCLSLRSCRSLMVCLYSRTVNSRTLLLATRNGTVELNDSGLTAKLRDGATRHVFSGSWMGVRCCIVNREDPGQQAHVVGAGVTVMMLCCWAEPRLSFFFSPCRPWFLFLDFYEFQ